MKIYRLLLCLAAAAVCFCPELSARELRVLFLGDDGHHRPADRFKDLEPVMRAKKIELTYTASLADLNPLKLEGFDALLIFANHTRIAPEQEAALLQFVEKGGGLVPLHCASYCFLNSPKYIELVGAQFKSHGAGVFKETLVNKDHPVMKGLTEIESWDESYVHEKHNKSRVVLAERRDSKGSEPYTWVREQGKGRVFYTAWGHDARTWTNANFQSLVENGIRWAAGNSPAQLKVAEGLKPFEYMDAPSPLPNYVAGARWGTQAEPIRTMQKPLEPAESLKHAAVYPGFEKTLFAHEPDIVKPIWMAWDERGRLWIAETIDYPNEMQPFGQGRDRLKILEDSNGDGKADKFTVFADRLSVPTSFVFANGGVIVVHSGKSEFFKDTTGDDRADERRDLFVGWGTGDTHAGPSNLRYGFDNWIWGTVGYSGFRGTVGGKEIRFGQGIFRFKPDGSALEFVRSSNNNTWGLGFTEEGIVFGSTANNNASMYMPVANRFYEGVSGWSGSRIETIADTQRIYPITEKVRQVDQHDRYTAGSGSAIYTARSFPKAYWNKAQFVTEPTGHLIGQFFLIPKGADFVAHNAANFLASDDEWTSPIAAEVGPDGALWVIDWYNYIIQHNPTPQGFQNGKGNAYETPLRDKVHGRIYKVAYAKGKPSKQFDLKKSSDDLINALKSDNLQWRLTAQRLIVDGKKSDLVPALIKLVQDTSMDELKLNPGAIHALWSLQGLGAMEQSEVQRATVAALKHPSPGVRRTATTVLVLNDASRNAILEGKLLNDSDPQVRLAALLALSQMPPSAEAGEAILTMLQDQKNSEDRWIPDAATAAAAKNDAAFLKAVLAKFKPAGEANQPQSQTQSANLIQNGSFEDVDNNRPKGWQPVTHSGRGELALENIGRTGSKSVKIASQNGGDISWATRVQLKPRTEYRVSGWIKTENVQRVGNALGALLNVHELQDPVRGATKGVVGNNDWTQVQMTFNSGQMTEVTVNCLFGGWGRVSGTAYFDDIEVTAIGGAEMAGEVGKVVRLVTAHYALRAPGDSIFETLSALKGASPALGVPILDGLISGWPEGKAPSLDDQAKRELNSLMDSLPETLRDRLLSLAQKWDAQDLFASRLAEITKSMQVRIADASVKEDERIAAAKRLVQLSGKADAVNLLLKEINPLTSPALANGLIAAAAESRDAAAASLLLDHWNQLTPVMRRNVVAAMLRKTDWLGTLLDSVESGKLKRSDIATEHWAQIKQNPNRRLARRGEDLSKAGGAAVSKDMEQIAAKLLPLAKTKGDAARGKEVYAMVCAVCHVFNGQGGKVGPDLTGIGAKDPSEVLLDIIDPNRSVEANYQLWVVTTKEDETFSGRLETETQTTVEILDTTGNKHIIPRKDIASMKGTPVSIMPAGFEAMPEEDLQGLITFLAAPEENASKK